MLFNAKDDAARIVGFKSVSRESLHDDMLIYDNDCEKTDWGEFDYRPVCSAQAGEWKMNYVYNLLGRVLLWKGELAHLKKGLMGVPVKELLVGIPGEIFYRVQSSGQVDRIREVTPEFQAKIDAAEEKVRAAQESVWAAKNELLIAYDSAYYGASPLKVTND